MKLTHCTTVTLLQRLQRKSIPKILRQSTDYNLQSKIKTYQKQYTVFIKTKTKKKPQYRLCTKMAKPNQNPNRHRRHSSPLIAVANRNLAPHWRSICSDPDLRCLAHRLAPRSRRQSLLVVAPRTGQGVPRNTLTWKKLNFFFFFKLN